MLAGNSRVGIKRYGENIVLSMLMRCSSNNRLPGAGHSDTAGHCSMRGHRYF